MHIAEIFARSVFGLCGELSMVCCFMICHIGVNGMENFNVQNARKAGQEELEKGLHGCCLRLLELC